MNSACFALLALRIRTAGGLISEIEAVIRRQSGTDADVELKGATFSMFVPRLLADLDPAGFARPDPALLGRAGGTSRSDLLGAVDRYFEAFTRRDGSLAPLAGGCKRRENGIAASNLVLDLALLDNPGSATEVELPRVGSLKVPDSCLAPWADLHAQLFKIEAGRISHVEGLVRRVPYGQGSGWKV